MDLHILWFLLLGLLLAGYAILDGFDLGVGILHFVAKTDKERRIFINSIGPLWDGNEVWLVTFGGALFAAFPEAYATAFSGFYLAFMAVLFSLIFRAVSIEFRSKLNHPRWRQAWDFGFFASSLLAALLYGTAVGAAMIGIPLNEKGIFTGIFVNQLSLYALSVGVLTVAMFMMHGAIFLYLKTEGELQARVYPWIWRGFFFFLTMYVLVSVYTLYSVDRATKNFTDHPWLWIVVLLNVLAVANIPRAIYLRKPGYAFISSACTVAALVFLFGAALFPNLVTSAPAPENSLTIYNAASSETTLRLMAIFAGLGIPFVLAYTTVVYWTFGGKVELDDHSY
jgi:cytochrome d ubiquinol oxidase subunit II